MMQEPVLHLRTGKVDSDAAFALILRLEQGEPGIHCDPSRIDEGIVIISASCLKPEDPETIAVRLNELLAHDSKLTDTA